MFYNLFLALFKFHILQEPAAYKDIYGDIVKEYSNQMKVDTVLVYDKTLYFDKDIVSNIRIYDFLEVVEKDQGRTVFGLKFMPFLFKSDTVQINIQYISGKREGSINKCRFSNGTQFFVKFNKQKKQFEIVARRE
jgi:hypothetical protein